MSEKRYRTSAGLFLYRRHAETWEVLIGHPGGPFFAKKDAGAWTVLKGEFDAENEDPEVAARREFNEETGFDAPPGPLLALGEITQKGGKRVVAFAVAGDVDPDAAKSNHFEMEWPPRSGRRASFPEIDRVMYASLDVARDKLKAAQVPLVERLVAMLDGAGAA